LPLATTELVIKRDLNAVDDETTVVNPLQHSETPVGANAGREGASRCLFQKEAR
jgi:hypothetical protein